MNCYGALAAWYDTLTGDIPYGSFADFYEAEFAQNGGEFRLILDFCCGTGTLTVEMARRGYEMIAADQSAEMLMEARAKTSRLSIPPLFLQQSAQELDLYGTVDAAICSLDGVNYLPRQDFGEVLRRLHLFIRPGGLFIFDIKTPESLHALDGSVSVDEDDDVFCLWRADFDAEQQCLVYGMDLFEREGELWQRSGEEHVEYVYEEAFLRDALAGHGFTDVRFVHPGQWPDPGRVFVVSKRAFS